jgi:Ni/Co efflux regulator RcnB
MSDDIKFEGISWLHLVIVPCSYANKYRALQRIIRYADAKSQLIKVKQQALNDVIDYMHTQSHNNSPRLANAAYDYKNKLIADIDDINTGLAILRWQYAKVRDWYDSNLPSPQRGRGEK